MNQLPGRRLDEPLVFVPYFRPQVWGGRRLAELLHKPLPPGVAVGEAWELSAHALHVSRVSDGPWAGVPLSELWGERQEELCGETFAEPTQFPWLVKWLDCHDWLSVQVHPDDATAKRLLGDSVGKTESWVVLDAEPTARIFAGLKAGVTRQEVAHRSQDGTVADCLHSFIPRPGDCVHIPAGTVHAMGGGLVLAEVQQTSDATFRLFDWNRVDAQGKSRELHLEQALESIDFQRGPVQPIAEESVPSQTLVDCPYYRLERLRLTEPRSQESRDKSQEPAQAQGSSLALDSRLSTLDYSAAMTAASISMTVVLVLNGEAVLSTATGYQRTFTRGETVLLPAAVSKATWTPRSASLTLLRISLSQDGT